MVAGVTVGLEKLKMKLWICELFFLKIYFHIHFLGRNECPCGLRATDRVGKWESIDRAVMHFWCLLITRDI